MDLVPIGEAARLLGVNTSALRYYEERGLVRPRRVGGQRMFGRDDLRRLAFVQVVHRLGLDLNTAAAVLDTPSERWREVVRDQITRLDELIRQARAAQQFLTHAANCPAEHPVGQCPTMTSGLDRWLAGVPFEQLSAEHGVQ
ncbi:MAG TPA: MerR family transcriptional regulator [Actinophytocola sp.]|jgi:DNA-binding transcriptional MerR regulator|uniref:MerR family transcriptional regulator n=1 Tax=Actinophytocola sp. TaxID=1872138 RepID=UPI002DFE917A|nr:MerR family transcriptional regulator [Actinophytocola sp.]